MRHLAAHQRAARDAAISDEVAALFVFLYAYFPVGVRFFSPDGGTGGSVSAGGAGGGVG